MATKTYLFSPESNQVIWNSPGSPRELDALTAEIAKATGKACIWVNNQADSVTIRLHSAAVREQMAFVSGFLYARGTRTSSAGR